MKMAAIDSVLHDCNVLHDMANEVYEGHEFSKDGELEATTNALIALFKMYRYVQDMIEELEQDNIDETINQEGSEG